MWNLQAGPSRNLCLNRAQAEDYCWLCAYSTPGGAKKSLAVNPGAKDDWKFDFSFAGASRAEEEVHIWLNYVE